MVGRPVVPIRRRSPSAPFVCRSPEPLRACHQPRETPGRRGSSQPICRHTAGGGPAIVASVTLYCSSYCAVLYIITFYAMGHFLLSEQGRGQPLLDRPPDRPYPQGY